MEFLHQFVTDLGATVAAGNVVVGDRLGLYRALADRPQRPAELAARTGTAPRYVAEWLRGPAGFPRSTGRRGSCGPVPGWPTSGAGTAPRPY